MNKADFDIYFDNAFGTLNQTKFEEWFANMAACVFGLDFELIKAGGRYGDKKSDGRRISTETIYQCFAPESPKSFADKAATKIQDSFPEVTEFWPNLKEWIFVHNNADGLPSSASDKLEEVRLQFPNVTISASSPPRRFLKDKFHDKLTVQQMLDVYPSAQLNFQTVKMENIRPLLRRVIRERSEASITIGFGEEPDEEKLDFNQLSLDAKHNINRARPHVDVVDRYIDGLSKPRHATLIQSEMKSKYEESKSLGYSADEIVGIMLNFVGSDGTPTVNSAAYVILTYYFDACDIFENVPEENLC